VRSEILGVIARAIEKCATIPVFQEMRSLLADGDAEANFFNNVYHIQAHRRTRALRRLAQYCHGGRIRSSTISGLFVPLVGHFVANADVDHHVVNEAIITIGHLAGGLTWSAYNALVQQHLKEAKEKNGQEKIHVRTLVSILDSFHFQLDDIMDDDVEPVGEAGVREQLPAAGDLSPALTSSMRMKITDAVSQRLLPALLQFMEKRDEAEDSLRIPISVGIVRVAQYLPESTRTPQIEKLITVLSQALRSKSQETRDMVRETMSKIAVMLGPQMLPTIIRELRAALARGPQLHVLAFVTYTVLAHITSSEHVRTFGNLDDSVDGVAHIAAEVIFGQSGRDVQSEDFRTKMREVRGSATRGLDTFAIMAKYISPSKISGLLTPIRAIMHETEALKVMQKVDDVLRRVASGLNGNAYLTPSQLLVLCHTFLSQNAKFLRQESGRPAKRRKTDFDVQMKRTDTANEDCYANNSHKFVAFGLDLFVTAFRRSLFDFNDRDVISRLEPMVGVIGNTLYSIDAHVVVLGLRAAAAIVRCPVSSISKSLPVYQRQILAIIRQAGTTESDVVQNAFKSLAIIIRDCPEAGVQANDLTYLLEVLAPDLEEKDRQVAVFALLRAIVSRKFVVPEIYDIMDKVAEIMVTNQSAEVQELCRGVYLQFLLDYPQGKGRLRTQMTFLAKNLSYVFESGRQSVMELLSAIFSKFEPKLVYEYSDLFFVALFMVIANDDSAKCRAMAGELIKALFIRLDEHHREIVMDHLRTWAYQKSQLSLLRTVAQVYGLLVDVLGADAQAHMAFIIDVLNGILETSAAILRGLELPDDDVENVDTPEIEWQLPYQSLSSLLKIVRISSDFVRAPGRIRWDCISAHTLFPHTWVRLASSRLIGFLFNAFPIGPPSPDLPASHPLSPDGFMEVARKLCIQLRSPNLDDTLSLQLVKNLFYVGKCFHTWPRLQLTPTQLMEESDEEGDEVHLTTTIKNYDNEAGGNLLPWLFSKLSYQARSAHIARRNRTSTEVLPFSYIPRCSH
jgi:U3 small nucleolar RNA-associated protein 20